MRNELLLVPSFRAQRLAGNRIRLTNKFVQGMLLLTEYWPGPVATLLRTSTTADNSLDHVDIAPSDLPFTVELSDADRPVLIDRLRSVRAVLGTLTRELLWLEKECREAGAALIWTTETSLATRKQIVDAEVSNLLKRARRKLLESFAERSYRKVITTAAGIQCNGTPTFSVYEPINSNAIVFFDGRVRASQISTPLDIGPRLDRMLGGAPLTLAFSGRLVAIKGVGHIPHVADDLRRRRVPFRFLIYGAGDMQDTLRARIAEMNLGDQVRLEGVLDFESELLPTIRSEVDLFVCCHLQGDPSCTYLETLSCGTPIIGYANEAWAGLERLSSVGWSTPLGKPHELAAAIEALHRDRPALAEHALRALNFAAMHSFEATTRSRVEHLLKSSECKV